MNGDKEISVKKIRKKDRDIDKSVGFLMKYGEKIRE